MHEHGTAHDATRASFVADLHPAYFAMVMATGIVSIASLLVGFRTIGVALLPANVVFALDRPDIRPGFIEELRKLDLGDKL